MLILASHSEHKAQDCMRWLEFYKDKLMEKTIKDNKVMDMTITPVDDFVTLNESGFTARDNAIQKAKEAFNVTQKPCFAEDTSFYIHTLGGPGCFFHRMMESIRSEEEGFGVENIPWLLTEMGAKNRSVTATTVFAYYNGDEVKCFSSSMNGTVAFAASAQGYMFDKIFVPDLEALPEPRDLTLYASRQAFMDEFRGKTFGELPLAVLDAISFKRMAFLQMMCYLEEIYNTPKQPAEVTG